VVHRCIDADIEVVQRSCRVGGAVLSRCRGGLSEVLIVHQVQIVRCKGSEVQRCRGHGAEVEQRCMYRCGCDRGAGIEVVQGCRDGDGGALVLNGC
jgi:hypothetical protein